MRVGLVFGGRSVEHRVSVVSARSVAVALREAGHVVVPIGVAEDGCFLPADVGEAALDSRLDALPSEGIPIAASLRHLLLAELDVVFPLVHGTYGEDGTLQGLLEMLDLPYVGPGVAASAVAMDKRLCKEVLAAEGVPVVPFRAFTRADVERDVDGCVAACGALPAPLFVKPAIGGSSVGVARVETRAELAEALRFALRFDETVLVEQGMRGRELECAVLGYPTLEAATAIGEIVPGNSFYDYEDKYLADRARLIAPAELPPKVAADLRALAVRAFAAIGGSGMARVDFFLVEDDGGPQVWVNEINTIPGFTRISMYPRLWGLSGLPLPALVDRLLELAVARQQDRRRLDAGIKEFLASLGG